MVDIAHIQLVNQGTARMSSQKRKLETSRYGKDKLTKLSKDSKVMLDDAVEITNKLVQSALEAKTKEIKMLEDERKKFAETLDEVDDLWKNYDADLKTRNEQIEALKNSIKIQNETILKLKNEIQTKDLVTKDEVSFMKERMLKIEMDKRKEDLALVNKMKEMKDTISKLKEEAEKSQISESALIKENNELSTIYNENKRLEKENVVLKENLKMKEIQLEKYKRSPTQINQELSKINVRLSVDLDNQTCMIKQKENEIEEIKKKYKLREDEIKDLTHIIIKSKQNITKFTNDSLSEISRLREEIKLMKETTNIDCTMDDMWRKRLKDFENRKDKEINGLNKTISKIKAKMKADEVSHNSTLLSLQKRYKHLITLIKSKRNIKKGNIDVVNKNPEVTEDDDIVVVSDVDNIPDKVSPKCDSDKTKPVIVPMSQSISNNVTNNSISDNTDHNNVKNICDNTLLVTSIDIHSTPQISKDYQQYTADTFIEAEDQEYTSSEIVATILKEILQNVKNRTILATDNVGVNEIETWGESSMREVGTSEEDPGLMFAVPVLMAPAKVELKDTSEVVTVKKEQEDVTHETPLIPISDADKVGVEDDEIDPLKFSAPIKVELNDTSEVFTALKKQEDVMHETTLIPISDADKVGVGDDEIDPLKFSAPVTVELNNTSEVVTAKKEQQDVMHETPLIPISDADKVGVGDNEIDPIMKFNLNVMNTVRKVLLFFYEQERKIGSKEEFIHLCKQFTYKFREIIMESYSTFEGSLEGIYLTPDNRAFIKTHIDMYFEKRKLVV